MGWAGRRWNIRGPSAGAAAREVLDEGADGRVDGGGRARDPQRNSAATAKRRKPACYRVRRSLGRAAAGGAGPCSRDKTARGDAGRIPGWAEAFSGRGSRAESVDSGQLLLGAGSTLFVGRTGAPSASGGGLGRGARWGEGGRRPAAMGIGQTPADPRRLTPASSAEHGGCESVTPSRPLPRMPFRAWASVRPFNLVRRWAGAPDRSASTRRIWAWRIWYASGERELARSLASMPI